MHLVLLLESATCVIADVMKEGVIVVVEKKMRGKS